MLSPQDTIYYIEQRFSCRQGYPGRSIDPEGLHRYVTLVAHGDDGVRGSVLINAMREIADRMKFQVPGKPILHWRYVTKVDDYAKNGHGVLVARIFIEGCNDYGKQRFDAWSLEYPRLVYSRPAPAPVELRPEARAICYAAHTGDGPEVA